MQPSMDNIKQSPNGWPSPARVSSRWRFSGFLLQRVNVKRRFYYGLKRLIDLGAAGVGLFGLLVISPLIWLVNLLTSPGDLLYVQDRVGQGNRIFRMVKFRSMIMNAEADTGPVWAQENDARITPIGHFLRKSRLDEMPQFWNVLKGEMSLVGPRPERPEFVESLVEEIPEFQSRHVVKPGITGWAQVNHRYVASVDDTLIKLQYDLYYIEHQGGRLDTEIVSKTVRVVLAMQGM